VGEGAGVSVGGKRVTVDDDEAVGFDRTYEIIRGIDGGSDDYVDYIIPSPVTWCLSI